MMVWCRAGERRPGVAGGGPGRQGVEAMRFRWSDGRGAAVEFTAADAEGLARAATDAGIDFRRKTVRRGGAGGGASYPAAQLHVHVGIAWSFPADRRLHARPGRPQGRRAAGEGGAAIECPGLPPRLVLDGTPPPGASDVEICRSRARRWWDMAVTARRNAETLIWLFGDVRRMIELALGYPRRPGPRPTPSNRANGEITLTHMEG